MPKTHKKKIATASGHSGPIAVNRKAYHEYDILENVEAGLVLTGTEIKSVRASKIDIQHSFARMYHGEMWLVNAHIAPYAQGNIYNHEPTRSRKLLLHNKELRALAGTASQKGLTLIPLRVYIKGHVAKVQVGLARGRQLHDKRRAMMDKDQEREIGRAIRAASRG
jgi:SsrA-binding protein